MKEHPILFSGHTPSGRLLCATCFWDALVKMANETEEDEASNG